MTFSYQTIVSFEVWKNGEYNRATIENLWSVTTGKLLNKCCPDKSKRLSVHQFKLRLTEALKVVA